MNTSTVIPSSAALNVDTKAIRDHYDSLSLWYRLMWGEHLHHGWFKTGNERATEAQIEMLWQCVSMLKLPVGARTLDVGCGYGGTSIFLASKLDCRVDGLSLSRNQLAVADRKAVACGVRPKVRFHLQNAENFAYPPDYYDLVWTMESSEHFADKQQYFHNVGRTLRRDGRLLLAAWTGSMADSRVRNVAEHFLCPQLCTADDFVNFIEAAGMQVETLVDATRYVLPTWQICLRRIKRLRFVKPFLPVEVRSFADGLAVILDSYLSGQLTYTVITARS